MGAQGVYNSISEYKQTYWYKQITPYIYKKKKQKLYWYKQITTYINKKKKQKLFYLFDYLIFRDVYQIMIQYITMQ